MMRKPPPFTQGFVDRHGHARWYFRRPGFRVPLPGLPWSPDFMQAYQAAKESWEAGKAAPVTAIGSLRTKTGTMGALIGSYYGSSDFLTIRPNTKAFYRNLIEKVRVDHGHRMVKELQRSHIQKIMAGKAELPAAANNILKIFRVLMRHALDCNMRLDNPTLGIRKIKSRSAGFRTWTEDEIQKFYASHSNGTRARLAFDLLLYTGQRRSDVIRMGRQHVRNGVITIRQSKTNTEVSIPLHAQLAAALGEMPNANLTFLLTAAGKPFTPAGFGNWFRDCVRDAQLPDGLAAHGLRKAACRRLAEAGCSTNEIMSISGHRNLTEVSRYTEAANRARMAERAISSIAGHESEAK